MTSVKPLASTVLPAGMGGLFLHDLRKALGQYCVAGRDGKPIPA